MTDTYTMFDKFSVFSGVSGKRGMWLLLFCGMHRIDFLMFFPISLAGDF